MARSALGLLLVFPAVALAGDFVTNPARSLPGPLAATAGAVDGQVRASDFNALREAANDLRTHATGWVNVKSYGAKGDGVADDTAAIQAAIDSLPLNVSNVGILAPRGFSNGGVVHFPRGRYKVTRSIALKRGVHIAGESRESSQVISFTSGSVFRYADSGRYVPDEITFDDLSIWQHDSVVAQTGAAIEVTTGTASPPAVSFRGSDLMIEGTYRGVLLSAGIACRLTDSIISKTVSHGVHVRFDALDPNRLPTTSTVFQSVYSFLSKTGDGFRFEAASYVSCLACAADSNQRFGYSFEGGSTLGLFASGAEENGEAGVSLKDTRSATITVDVVSPAGRHDGIWLSNAANTVISGSTFHSAADTSGFAVNVQPGNGPLIIIGSTYAGAYLTNKVNTDLNVLHLGGDVAAGSSFVGGRQGRYAFGVRSPDPAAQLLNAGSAPAGVDSGLKSAVVFSSAGARRNASISAQAITADASVRYPQVTGVEVMTPSKGAASAVDRIAGVTIAEQVGGSLANANLVLGGDVAPAGNWSLFSASERDSVFKGRLRFRDERGPTFSFGLGSPEGVLAAPAGSLYGRTDGGPGTTLYVKERGSDTNGWVAK
jgi:hypothetical protein